MADSSSKLVKLLSPSFSDSSGNKTNFDASKINPRILKILGLDEFDIEDEQEYLSLLKEKMLLISMGKSKLSREDEELIIKEFKRIKSKKFPQKKITADIFKKNLSLDLGTNFNLDFNDKISTIIGKPNFNNISELILDNNFLSQESYNNENITKLISGKKEEPSETEEVKNIKTTKVNTTEEVVNFITKLISGKKEEPSETEEVNKISKNLEEKIISEEIDERILRLLNLKDTFDIDYGTYISLLKEQLALSSLGKQKIPREEEILLQEEYKRVKSKKDKGRFKAKIKITAEPFVGNIKKNLLFGEPEKRQLALPPAVDKMSGKSDIQEIIDALSSIIEQLTLFNSLSRDEQERDRRARENRRRREREGELEKGFDGVMKAAEKIIAPVKSILNRIIDFLVITLIGRSLILLLRWFSDSENKKKVEAIGRFLGDHWPKLLALFIAFGTGLGGFVRGLIGVVIKGTGALIKGAFWLAKQAGIKKAAGALKFLGGPKGKLIGAGVEVLAVAGGTLALSKGLENFGGIGGEETKKPKEETTPRVEFSGGGFADFGKMFGGAALGAGVGSMFGPMGMLLGAGLGGAAGSGMFNGMVSGPKGTDKVPAMLTDGEFVMSTGAVQKYGVDTLEAMNAAGGGNNRPKVVQGTTYAFGGGFVGDDELYRMAANHNRGENLPQISYDPNNEVHRNTYEKIKKVAIKRGVYKPPTGVKTNTYTSPNVNNNVNVNYKPSSSSSIVRSQPGTLSTNVRPPVQRINTNMNVPGGRIRGGSLSAIMAAIEMKERMGEGQTATQAGLGAGGSALGGQLGWMAGAKSGAIAGAALGSIVPGLGTAAGGAVGAIVGGLAAGYGGAMLGGKLADDFSGVNATKERKSRGGIGGAIKGGWGLKERFFEDAPDTMVMTDPETGIPFVGYKAKKGGKLTYVRPSRPGTGTTNPFEALGRMINPSAYIENDKKLAMKKQKIAMVNALETFQREGMAPDAQARMMKQMGGNLKDVQNDLNFRKKTQAKIAATKPASRSSGITPPQQGKVNVTYVENMKKRRAVKNAGRPQTSSAPTIPQFSSSKRTRRRGRTASTYGIG